MFFVDNQAIFSVPWYRMHDRISPNAMNRVILSLGGCANVCDPQVSNGKRPSKRSVVLVSEIRDESARR